MDRNKVNIIIDNAFDASFKSWNQQIDKELYPGAFADEYSWLRVKNSLKINNSLLKEALKSALSELLSDQDSL